MRTKKLVPFLVALVLVATALVPVSAATTSGTIVDVVSDINAETGEFSTLIAALEAAHPHVVEMLSSDLGQRTVFAPTDEAFEAALAELDLTAEELLADENLLTEILLYHVTWGRLYADDVLARERLLMLWGGFVRQEEGVLTDNLGRQATITQTDIEADNGIIHAIDNVLLPRGIDTRTIVDALIEINAETGEFSTLIAALDVVNPWVRQTLAADWGQRTLFAPTDAAFEAALAELDLTAEELLADEDLLARILLYHVTWGRLYADDVLARDHILMMWGGFVRQEEGVLTDNKGRQAAITQTDIEADNGIIHAIDNVLLPGW